MKVTLTSTTEITIQNGVRGRIWQGKTETGIDCYAFIPIMGVHKSDDATEFERDLQEHEPPSQKALQCFDPRLIL